jgi:hypothetical protein
MPPKGAVPSDRAVAPFFAVSCHGAITRRGWLAGALAAVALPAARGRAEADEPGAAFVRRHGSDPRDPWAVAHALLALGPELRSHDGRRATDVLLEDHLRPVPALGGALRFPPEIEAHPDMFLAEALLGVGVPLAHGFTAAGARHTLAEVVADARTVFRPAEVARDPNLLPWSLIALTRTTPPARARWRNRWGEAVDLHAVVEEGLGALERASAPVAAAWRAGRPLESQAPVHRLTCGGTHLLYALLVAAGQGYADGDRLARLGEQVALLVWRLEADVALIDRFYAPRRAHPAAAWWALDSKLKLLGHAGECLALVQRRGLVPLSAAQRAEARRAAAAVRRLVLELAGRGLEGLPSADAELRRQLVGDAAHAWHGLTA